MWSCLLYFKGVYRTNGPGPVIVWKVLVARDLRSLCLNKECRMDHDRQRRLMNDDQPYSDDNEYFCTL